MSNGGHSRISHGVAMVYNNGQLSYRFRKKDGQEWRVDYDNVLPGRWYHLVSTWSQDVGLRLGVNGEHVDTDAESEVRSPLPNGETTYNEFKLGRPNDDTVVREKHPIVVDEFNFWSDDKSPGEMRDLGRCFVGLRGIALLWFLVGSA